MARKPDAITPEKEPLLFEALRLGMPDSRACHLAGVTWRTFRRWLDRGEQITIDTIRELEARRYKSGKRKGQRVFSDDQIDEKIDKLAKTDPYVRFCHLTQRAKAEGELTQLQVVGSGAPGWQGSAWILERTRRDGSYRKHDELDVKARHTHEPDETPSIEETLKSERAIELLTETIETIANGEQ